MMKLKWRMLLLLMASVNTMLVAQAIPRQIRTVEYKNLQARLSKGWNTWYNNSVISEVLLPESFAINLCLTNKTSPDYLREVFKAAPIMKRPENVTLGLRADDGSYTNLTLKYKGDEITVQTATDGDDQLILVTPAHPSANYLVVEAGLLWNREGTIGMKGQTLVGQFASKAISVKTTEQPISDAYAASTAPRITLGLATETAVYTGKTRMLSEIKTIIQQHQKVEEHRTESYGDLADNFRAMQTILAWNTIYDAPNNRVITPVSRLWNYRWGAGYVLFDWDTYFASNMLALYNKDLAYANAIEITKAITPEGFVPNYQSPSRGSSLDRSQPPVGSTIVLNIYHKYREKWFLNEVYRELLTWNRWWPKNRDVKGYLAWGSYDRSQSQPVKANVSIANSKYESGLDNSPMFDGIAYNQSTHMLDQADVGLMSLYIMDCHSLAGIAQELGYEKDAAELNVRASTYTKGLNTLWNEKTGIFLNKKLDTGEPNYRLSPTNFYPMLAKACTQAQAERMMKDHYFNPAEFYGTYVIPSAPRDDPAFKDNDYWRGRIWGPLNFLVYLGMQNYDVKAARLDLVKRSGDLFLQNWRNDGGIYENYNATTGEGGDVLNADSFYHWGALLTFIEFMEKGYMKPSK